MINRRPKVLQAKETEEPPIGVAETECSKQQAIGARSGGQPPGSALQSRSGETLGPWRATQDGFALCEKSVVGQLTLVRHDPPGLRCVTPRVGRRTNACSSPVLLGVRSVQAANRPAFNVAPGGTTESRVRGRLVDVQLDPGHRCPVRMHLYWLAGPDHLDLEILASCSDPLEHSEVLTSSCHTAGEVLVRASSRGTGWVDVQHALALGAEWLVFPRDRMAGIISLDGRDPSSDVISLATYYRQPVVLYRPAGQRWSYVEMSHPHDCMRIVVHVAQQRTRVSFGLFGLDLEKGVILRGRMRGIFIPRTNDTRRCLRQYARFVAEPPRLSV